MPKLNVPFSVEAEVKKAVVPKGIFPAVITGTHVEYSGDFGNEAVVEVQLLIEDGPVAGTEIVQKHRIDDANPETQKRARLNFASLVQHAGFQSIEDTDELHGKKISIKVDIYILDDGIPRNSVSYMELQPAKIDA